MSKNEQTAPLDVALTAEISRIAAPIEVLVVDLDDTLWKGNCERFAGAIPASATEVVGASGESLHIFPEAALVLRSVFESGIRIAVASNSPAKATALLLLRQFGLAPF